MDIYAKLALLTDEQVHRILNRVIEGYAARNPDFPVSDPKELTLILSRIGDVTNETVAPRVDSNLSNLAAAERNVLVHLAGDPRQAQLVAGAIDNDRAVLVEPITAALIMVAIVFVLETELDVKVSRRNGVTEYDVRVGKKPTDKSIIKELFSLFS
ncbi:MAG TPA: hypothetical protein VNK51_08960 [Bradyrhizobium sp.]|nr:hypothetical protein [Bradyrhizobium sp.]